MMIQVVDLNPFHFRTRFSQVMMMMIMMMKVMINKTISDGGIIVDFWFIKVHTSN